MYQNPGSAETHTHGMAGRHRPDCLGIDWHIASLLHSASRNFHQLLARDPDITSVGCFLGSRHFVFASRAAVQAALFQRSDAAIAFAAQEDVEHLPRGRAGIRKLRRQRQIPECHARDPNRA